MEIDDKVLVRNNIKNSWEPYHFAKLGNDGFIAVFKGGTTSFTAEKYGLKCIKYVYDWKLPDYED